MKVGDRVLTNYGSGKISEFENDYRIFVTLDHCIFFNSDMLDNINGESGLWFSKDEIKLDTDKWDRLKEEIKKSRLPLNKIDILNFMERWERIEKE